MKHDPTALMTAAYNQGYEPPKEKKKKKTKDDQRGKQAKAA